MQLYSLREEIQKEGLDAILSGIRAAGADGVEAVEDAYGWTPAAYRAALDKHGLTAFGCHIGMASLADHTLTWSGTLGFRQLVVPWLSSETLKNDLQKTAAALNAEAEFYAQHGIAVGYHNHAHEFEGGADTIADLLRAAPALQFEPDIFWLAAAGKSATAYLKPYEKRLLTIHLKELNKDGIQAPNPPFGEGVSEIRPCVQLAEKLKLPHVVIEFEGIAVPWREYLKKAVAYIHG
ncbi:xylose isomerase [Clostridia bacterium]|nr:xylose isomerase [Clostridia bacterium]